MSYNGSGTFLINTAGQPVVSGTVISSTAFNALTADLATGLSTAITKDGQTTVTANIPMGTYKFTGLGAGTAATDSANLSQVQSTVTKLLASVSGADTITAVASPTLGAYAAGQMFYFIAAGDNTGAVTLNIDSLGAKAVTRDGSVALAASDLKSGEVVVVVYDGTRFQVVSQLNSAGDARFANVSIASALNVGGVATFTGGTANGVTYLNGSKALTSGTALTFDGSNALGFGTGGTGNTNAVFTLKGSSATDYGVGILATRNSANSWLISNAGLALGGGAAGVVYYNYVNNDPWIWYDGANSAERLRLTGNGNLGLGVTPSAWQSTRKAIQVGSTGSFVSSAGNTLLGDNYYVDSSGTNRYLTTASATIYQQAGQHAWYTAPSGTAGNAISFTEAMKLDTGSVLSLQNNTAPALKFNDASGTAKAELIYRNSSTGNFEITNVTNNALVFGTNNTERARITSGGDFLVGKTSTGSGNGCSLEAAGVASINRASATPCFFNRNTNDGTIVSLQQDGVEEGTISVSGNTVSYNAFAGSHWSQLQDGSKPDILRGTVMESINELCVWPDEQNERLPKAKISDTAGSKKVYGVFMAWDNDWTTTNDMYVTAVGAFICRVNGSVTVQEGDLLESNGDGTARVQADDIIRSSTIGKVTSTVKTHQYDDGSYCVPTVLYCG